MKKKPMHWADSTAQRVIQIKRDKDSYTVASGITPSGVVHIGNFREIITVDLIARALRDKGKEVRFIYSWDDYDVFRKVPKGFPKSDELENELRKPIVDVFDPYGKDESFARHNEIAVERELPRLGINPEYIYQNKEYRACKYHEGMKAAEKGIKKGKKLTKKIIKDTKSERETIKKIIQNDLKKEIQNLGKKLVENTKKERDSIRKIIKEELKKEIKSISKKVKADTKKTFKKAKKKSRKITKKKPRKKK